MSSEIKNIKILHIIRNAQIGGAEMLVKNIINSNIDPDFTHYLFYIKNGPLINLINNSKSNHLIYRHLNNKFSYVFYLRRILKVNNINIIHTHQPIDAFISALAAIKLNVHIVRTYHGYEGVYKNSQKLGLKLKLLYLFVQRFVCLNIYVSKELLNYYRLLIPWQDTSKQEILYNGIDIQNLEDQPKKNIRLELGLSLNSILMAMVGGFNTRGRDHYTICKALKKLLQTNPDYHFLFIGKTESKIPELFTNCYEYCKKNNLLKYIHFIGERFDVGGILKDIDIYVHSSNNDTFGIALVEAIAIGKISIASDIPPFREISNNGQFVTLFKKGSEIDLCFKINNEIKYLNSEKNKKRIVQAKDYVRENFSIQIHLNNLHNLYRKCLK